MKPFSEDSRREILRELLDYKAPPWTDQLPYKDEFINANTIDLEPNDTIYRFFNKDTFFKTLKENKLCLVRPNKWADPYENYILSSIGITPQGKRVGFEKLRNDFYAQCWTMKSECDGLWRNYGKGLNGDSIAIKVKTSVNKLMDCFYDMTNNIFHSNSYFIGKVEYRNDEFFENISKTTISLIDHLTSIASPHSLLIKRNAFSYEEEVRLIFHKMNTDNPDDFKDVKNKWDDSDKFFVSFAPNILFDEVEIDPWLSEEDCNKIIKEIRDLGYTGLINQSQLYYRPNFNLKISDWL